MYVHELVPYAELCKRFGIINNFNNIWNLKIIYYAVSFYKEKTHILEIVEGKKS